MTTSVNNLRQQNRVAACGHSVDCLVSVSGAEYRRVLAENSQLRAKSFWKSESALLESAATLMETEAQTWAEGFAVREKDGWRWDRENEWAHVRYYRLTRTAQRLRSMAARIYSANEKAET